MMDVLSPMNVIKIYEFGTLKFLGYIKKLSTAGEIAPDGRPVRTFTISGQAFGAILVETAFVSNFALFPEGGTLEAARDTFYKNVAKIEEDGGVSLYEAINVIMDSYFDILGTISSVEKRRKYINAYIDFKSGTSSLERREYPKEVSVLASNDYEVTLWELFQRIAEFPFNEIFFDVGPRTV